MGYGNIKRSFPFKMGGVISRILMVTSSRDQILMMQERGDTREEKSLNGQGGRDLCRVEGLPLNQRTKISSTRGGLADHVVSEAAS